MAKNIELPPTKSLLEKYQPLLMVKLSSPATIRLGSDIEKFASDIREKSGYEVVIIFTLSDKEAVFEICDKGKPMDPERLKKADLATSHVEKQHIDSIADCGRGLGIMKEIMDGVEYRTGDELNCLVLKKSVS